MRLNELKELGERKGSPLVGVLCSDIHLSIKSPVARSAEDPDWFGAMKRPLNEISEIAEFHGVPVVCAGDVFDKWQSPPHLINFAIHNLPDMYSIPGQHDLPYHSYDDLQRSAYWTLQTIGKLKKLTYDEPTVLGDLVLHGVPWGFEIKPLKRDKDDDRLHLAVIHAYNWTKLCKYPGAKKNEKLSAYTKRLRGYDCAVFGDNHKGFLAKAGDCNVINTGGLMRRTTAERKYEPRIGLLYRDGSIKRHKLDCSLDKFIEVENKLARKLDNEVEMSHFLDELKQLGDTALNYRENLKQVLKTTAGPVKDVIRALLEELD